MKGEVSGVGEVLRSFGVRAISKHDRGFVLLDGAVEVEDAPEDIVLGDRGVVDVELME